MTPEQISQIALALGSGLVGSLIGAGAALWAQSRDRRQRAEGAGRAIHFEMAYNVGVLNAAALGKPGWGGLSGSMWLAEAHSLAMLLSADEFRTVADSYVLLPRCMSLLDAESTGVYELTDSDREFCSSVARDFHEGAEILRLRVWHGISLETK